MYWRVPVSEGNASMATSVIILAYASSTSAIESCSCVNSEGSAGSGPRIESISSSKSSEVHARDSLTREATGDESQLTLQIKSSGHLWC